jgi:hypothetical protein
MGVTKMTSAYKGPLDTHPDADGDGIISQEEWEAEWASRGDLAGAVTRETTRHQLAVDYPGATIKNKIGPRSPHVLNTPFTAARLPANSPPLEDKFVEYWGKAPQVEPTAAMLFEQSLANKRGSPSAQNTRSIMFSAQGVFVS